jgi:hypothetical protein
MHTVPQRKYWGYVRGLGGSAIVVFIVGFMFRSLIPTFPETIRKAVIVQALPFIAFFASILLLFIMSVALLGVRFHLVVPNRTHRAVEFTIIASILLGIVALFQPWQISPYTFGFSLLLFSVLTFIVWSHVAPRSSRESDLPAFTQGATTTAIIIGLMVAAIVFGSLALTKLPKEPYGIRQRVWNTMDEEKKAEAADKAMSIYRSATLPFFIVYALMPGLVVFFLTRELASKGQKERAER